MRYDVAAYSFHVQALTYVFLITCEKLSYIYPGKCSFLQKCPYLRLGSDPNSQGEVGFVLKKVI